MCMYVYRMFGNARQKKTLKSGVLEDSILETLHFLTGIQ